MNYRTLLVLLDQDPLCASRTRAAIQLAKHFGAHLRGLAPTGQVELSGALTAASSSAELASVMWESLRGQADTAASNFDKACAALHFSACDAVIDEGEAVTSLLRHANGHDLTVLSQPDPSAPGAAARRDLVERTMLFSARPTLLIPYAGTFDHTCPNVMVAWDGSREAARAIADAMPFLQRARHVDVVSWRENGRQRNDLLPSQLEDVRQWLLRHDVQAKVHVEELSGPIADAILSQTADLDSDLLVMGAYGHSRWAERVLGGATRGVLATTPVPVLMSH